MGEPKHELKNTLLDRIMDTAEAMAEKTGFKERKHTDNLVRPLSKEEWAHRKTRKAALQATEERRKQREADAKKGLRKVAKKPGVLDYLIDPRAAMEDKADAKKLDAAAGKARPYRQRTSPSPFGDPARGGYWVDEGTWGKSFIEVAGTDLVAIMWGTAPGGYKYLDVAGNPIEIVGTAEDLLNWFDENADKFLANSINYSGARMEDYRINNERMWLEVPEAKIHIAVQPFHPMKYSKRAKVFNVNRMVAKFYLDLGMRALSGGVGAANPQETPMIVEGLQTVGDVGAFMKETSEGGAIGKDAEEIATKYPLYTVLCSSGKASLGGTAITPGGTLRIDKYAVPACKLSFVAQYVSSQLS